MRESFVDNTFNYGPNTCYKRLGTSGILINKDNITKYKQGFGWSGFVTGDAIPKYYQYILRKIRTDINIYIPFCDFNPLVGQLGNTHCAKSIGYRNIQRYQDYINLYIT